ncbi:helix-turn-helix transcriptional regulator [Pantoea stewartii]|uniref:helix-turn-helix transcriptional regulator n=1 Tax=Pantoea stewartii TaxID=66269 RepID=UPI0037094059
MDMIFYLMKNLSQKEVVNHLGLSAKTINNKMHNIYRKKGVNSVSALYEFCSHKNLQNYLPEFAINKGIKFI